jgi:hypothetical protein
VSSTTQGAQFALEKGGVLWLRGEPKPGGMEVVAAMPPRLLRRM